jgi:predicted ATP-grasp superfamily ATP-dependent carboligase
MPKYDVGELITALNEAVNKLNNLRVKYDDLEKERDKLRAALRDISRQPEGDEESAQAVARAVLGEKQ